MIFEHEIPTGSRLYFGKRAKDKRDLESKASSFLQESGFEEIVTPSFSYSGHQSIDEVKELITLTDEENNSLALRADSTLDVVRIISKRLGRTTEHKKWFYIQPVFSYPANETYQIGVEWIGYNTMSDIINLNCELLEQFSLEPLVQIANINIPLIISKQYDVDIEIFKDAQIGALFDLDMPWLTKLISIETSEELEKIMDIIPAVLKDECQKLIDLTNNIKYKRVKISPVYYSAMKYYDNIYYRVIEENLTLAKGGGYQSEGFKSLGFALYTDNLLKVMEG